METKKPRRTTHWPAELAPIGAIRFARRSPNFHETVRFYRELVGLPLYETFGESYGSNGAIFGLPSSSLTMEIVESVDAVAVDHHEQLCLYFPDKRAQQDAVARLQQEGLQPVEQHPYWEATGASPIAIPMAAKSSSRPSCTESTSLAKARRRASTSSRRTKTQRRDRSAASATITDDSENTAAHSAATPPTYSPYSADTGGLTLSL